MNNKKPAWLLISVLNYNEAVYQYPARRVGLALSMRSPGQTPS